jgi:hypothetical protein
MAIQPYLKLYRPAMKGVCLEWFFPNEPQSSVGFANWARANAPKDSGVFHQGGSHDLAGGWHLFEFWNYELKATEVYVFAHEAARRWGKKLIVEL